MTSSVAGSVRPSGMGVKHGGNIRGWHDFCECVGMERVAAEVPTKRAVRSLVDDVSAGLDACLAAALNAASPARRASAIEGLRCWLGRGESLDDSRILDALEFVCAGDSQDLRAAAASVLQRSLMRPDHRLTEAVSGRAWVWDGLDLRGIRLAGADLRRIVMRRAWLDGADLRGALLDGVDGYCARMSGVVLSRASLVGAEFSDASLGWADLSKADLRTARLNGANLDGAVLDGVQAERAFFSGAVLTRASLADANLRGANLFETRLDGARLDGADLADTGVTPERIKASGWRVHGANPLHWGRMEDRDGRDPLLSFQT